MSKLFRVIFFVLTLITPNILKSAQFLPVTTETRPYETSVFFQPGIKLGAGKSVYGPIFTGIRLNLFLDNHPGRYFLQFTYDLDIPPWPPLWYEGRLLGGLWQREWHEKRYRTVKFVHREYPRKISSMVVPYDTLFRIGYFLSAGTMMVPKEMGSPTLSSTPVEVANNNFTPELIPKIEIGLRRQQNWDYRIKSGRDLVVIGDSSDRGFAYLDGGIFILPPLNGAGVFTRFRYGSGLSGIGVELRIYYLDHTYKYVGDTTTGYVSGHMFGVDIISDWDGENILTLLCLICQLNM